jgi:hypothetical protein
LLSIHKTGFYSIKHKRMNWKFCYWNFFLFFTVPTGTRWNVSHGLGVVLSLGWHDSGVNVVMALSQSHASPWLCHSVDPRSNYNNKLTRIGKWHFQPYPLDNNEVASCLLTATWF